MAADDRALNIQIVLITMALSLKKKISKKERINKQTNTKQRQDETTDKTNSKIQMT